MPKPPESTKTSLTQRLNIHARARWPAVEGIEVRFRANFAYVSAHLRDGGNIPLCRLRYGGSASIWGFAFYRASHDDYEDNILPTGTFAGSPEDALECAGGVYLDGLTAWQGHPDTPTN